MGDQQLIDSFNDHLQKLDLWLRRQPNFAVHYIDYQEALADPAGTASDISRFLGRALDTEAMTRSVDPSLHRNRSKLQ